MEKAGGAVVVCPAAGPASASGALGRVDGVKCQVDTLSLSRNDCLRVPNAECSEGTDTGLSCVEKAFRLRPFEESRLLGLEIGLRLQFIDDLLFSALYSCVDLTLRRLIFIAVDANLIFRSRSLKMSSNSAAAGTHKRTRGSKKGDPFASVSGGTMWKLHRPWPHFASKF